jgi:low affinity Fe/Cu permease
MSPHKKWFSKFAKRAAFLAGTPMTFILAVGVVIVWVCTGPIFDYNDTWQLVINTGTTIVTFLMVFLIQNAQNRDSTAVQLKLDELIRAHHTAHNSLIDLEELETHELEIIRNKFEELASDARRHLRTRKDMAAEFDVKRGV